MSFGNNELIITFNKLRDPSGLSRDTHVMCHVVTHPHHQYPATVVVLLPCVWTRFNAPCTLWHSFRISLHHDVPCITDSLNTSLSLPQRIDIKYDSLTGVKRQQLPVVARRVEWRQHQARRTKYILKNKQSLLFDHNFLRT